jgi:hypothetical protein
VFRESGIDSIVTRYYDSTTGKLVGIVERMAGGKRWCAGRPEGGSDCRERTCKDGKL